jgi:4-hydroxy-tetrahydrodipicolinate synthase
MQDLFSADPQVMAMSITPFTTDGEVDEQVLQIHLDRLAGADLGVYLASPGSGEGHALSVKETRRVYEVGVEACGGRVPVCANPRESRGVADMLEVAREAVAAGVDAVQIYQIDGGHGFKPTSAELGAYFRDVICALDHPTVLGCNSVVGYLASVELLAELCDEFPQIVGVNLYEVPLGHVVACRDALPERVRLFVAQPAAVQSLHLGASGVLTAMANILPRTTAQFARAYAAGDRAALEISVQRLQRFFSAFVHSMAGAAWQKLALKILGLPGGNGVIRRPYLFPDAAAETAMSAELDRLGVREWEGLN